MLRLSFRFFFLLILFNFIYLDVPSKNNHNILNDAPVLDFIPDQNTDEDVEFNYTLSATDIDLDDLTFQVSISGDGTASITGQNNLKINPDLNFHGTIVVSITVSDGQLDDYQDFNLIVNSINDQPEITQVIANINADEDGNINDIDLSNYFSDIEDGNNLSYTILQSTQLNNDITTSINNSILSISLLPNMYDSGQITIKAIDSQNASIRQWVAITINPINDSPELNLSNAPSIIEVDNLYEYLVSPNSSDPDDYQFNYNVSINPDIGDPISIIATQNNQYGQLQWTPSIVGQYDITVIVEDWNASGGSNGQLDDNYTWSVNVVENNQNIPPVINSIIDQNINEESSFQYDLVISDSETPVNSLSVSVYDEYPGHNSYFTDINVNYVSNNWQIVINPESNWNGDINIIITVNDGINTTVEEFLLTINQVNDSPSFPFVNLIQFYEDSNYIYDLYIQDMDARSYYNKNATETITYSIQSLESDPSISTSLLYESIVFNNEGESNGVFSGVDDRNSVTFSPNPDFYGSEEFQLIITDLQGEQYSQNFYVQVQNVNDDPILDFIPEQNFDEDTFSSTISLNATDIDSNPNNFEYSCTSQNLLLNCIVTGSEIVLSNANEHFNGTEIITITVEDGDNGSDSQDVTVTVNPINDEPSIQDGTILAVEDGDIVNNSVSPLVSDIDADGISSYTLVDNIPGGQGSLIFDTATGDYSFDPGTDFQELAEGEQLTTAFTFYATDAGNIDTENATVTITVTGVNDLPIADDGVNTATEDGEPVSGSVDTNDVDSDGIATHTIDVNVTEGSAVLNNDGTYTFDPGDDFQDLAEGATREVFFTYYATDPHGSQSDTKTITITVTGVDDVPLLIAETYELDGVSQGILPSTCNHNYIIEINEGQALTINFKIDDIDTEDNHSLELESNYFLDNEDAIIDLDNVCFFDTCTVNDLTNDGICNLNCNPDFNGEFIQHFTTKRNSSTDNEAEITIHINIKQVNDKISNIILEENIFDYPNNANFTSMDLDIPDSDLFKYNDVTKFFEDDFNNKYLTTSSDTLKNFNEIYFNTQYQNFEYYMYEYHNYMKNDKPDFYFVWEKSEDIDTDPSINENPYNLFYRLELVEDDGNQINYYVLKDSIDNEVFNNSIYAWTMIEFDDDTEYPFYSSNQMYIPNNQILSNNNTNQKQKISNINGELKYSWRVVAQNYSQIELGVNQADCSSDIYAEWNDEDSNCMQYDEFSYYSNLLTPQSGIGLEDNDNNAMIAFKQISPLNEFYIDFQYVKGSPYVVLNEFFIDHYDFYVHFDSPLSFYDDVQYENNFYLNYVDGYLDVNDLFSFTDLGNNSNTYHVNRIFEKFGLLSFYYISMDEHRNTFLDRKSYQYELVLPDEISSVQNPSNNVLLEFQADSFNQESRILIDEEIYNIDESYIAVSDIVNIQSNQSLQKSYKIKFLQESIIGEYEFKDLGVYKIDNSELTKIPSYITDNTIEALINDFGSYVLLYDENHNDEIIVPEIFGIESCYPNPFNPIVSINYNLDKDSNIQLIVYNLLGQEIKVLENSYKEQGRYTTLWNGLNNNGDVMPSGIYFVKINNFEFADFRKITLLK